MAKTEAPPPQVPPEKRPKEPYVAPGVSWEEPFEPAAQATSCALLPLGGGNCGGRPQT